MEKQMEQYTCAICGKKKKLEREKIDIDHVSPLIAKQYLMNTCDDCFCKYIDSKESNTYA